MAGKPLTHPQTHTDGGRGTYPEGGSEPLKRRLEPVVPAVTPLWGGGRTSFSQLAMKEQHRRWCLAFRRNTKTFITVEHNCFAYIFDQMRKICTQQFTIILGKTFRNVLLVLLSARHHRMCWSFIPNCDDKYLKHMYFCH